VGSAAQELHGMSDLRDWLRSNKIEQYADAFEANDIDLDILPELSERDLEQLGLSLGNRRRLLKAIAERGAAKLKPSDAEATEASGDAERRQVTVLFCDMVGSTALSGTVDPELLGALIRRYQDAVAGAIGRFGGFVAKFMGDGVLAYFGFPRAFEDAAERAIRAAINVLAEVAGIELPDGTRVQARVGIATGLVVVGEIVGSGAAQERAIVGETPNLAARLQALAAPDTILVSEATQNLLGGLFELESTGEHELKGFARPVPAWRVVGEAAVESRFAASRAGRDLPMVGRAHEMGLMLDRWRLARGGEGQIVTVIGEAGIGKSRAIEALRAALAGEPHARIHLQGSPYYSDSALFPVIKHLSRAAHFAAADSAAVRIEKLRAAFAQRVASDAAALPLLAELLSIPADGLAPLPSLTPAQRKATTIALLVDEIVRLGETEPVLLVLEDAHWVDATTLELMTQLADSIGRARLLAVVTARPDFAAPWQTRPHSTLLSLGRLGRADCARLVAGVAASEDLSAETVAAILDKTDGIPLFAEEFTRSILESAGEAAATVPATLKDLLMARLDRLGAAREVAQIAAVVGRQFPFAILDAVVPRGGAALEAALTDLVAAGILLPEGRGLERGFSFKHALLRDAAYDSLLLTRRREWHERTARAVEERFPELAASEPEVLAYHFAEAGLPAPACDYRMRAGDRAASRSAYQEAVAHFSAGLKAAEALPASADRTRHQLDFLLKLGPALIVTRGMGSPEVEDAYRRAAEMGEATGDEPATFKAKWGLWLNANIRRKTALARDRADELLALAERSGDGDLMLEAHHCRWSTAFFRGDVAATLKDCRIGIATYDIARHRHLGHAFGGHDPGVCAEVCSVMALQMAGDKTDAVRAGARGLALAEALDHPNTLAHALHNIAIGHQLAGDRDGVYAAASRAVALAQKFGLTQWRANSLLQTAWAIAVGAGIADAAHLVDAEIVSATASGPLPQYFIGLAAEVLLGAGRAADALAHLDRAIAGIDEPGVGFYVPEIYRLRGECLLTLGRGNKDEARRAFATARDSARRQGAVIFARRAEACLAEVTNIRSGR
ncbi:MAG TPA: adenylate/guanylate cyclase domain-containing protein, partial [Xanthobacteraceae bacterium]|nr:adenylate/guanylate cyclase domain-containing protein [Xanthobacteraceae bacterium]